MTEFTNFDLNDFVAHANERKIGIERYKKRFALSFEETKEQNAKLIQKFTDEHFKDLLCTELGNLASEGKTRGVISLYCEEMDDVVETLE